MLKMPNVFKSLGGATLTPTLSQRERGQTGWGCEL